MIGNLQRLAGVLLIDCGTGIGQPGVQAAILASDQLVVVTDASGATASLVVEAMRLLERTGRPITVVCNRMRRGRQGNDDLLRMDALFPRGQRARRDPGGRVRRITRCAASSTGQAPLRRSTRSTLELAGALAFAWPELGLAPVG